jgi:hypothetical protein
MEIDLFAGREALRELGAALARVRDLVEGAGEGVLEARSDVGRATGGPAPPEPGSTGTTICRGPSWMRGVTCEKLEESEPMGDVMTGSAAEVETAAARGERRRGGDAVPVAQRAHRILAREEGALVGGEDLPELGVGALGRTERGRLVRGRELRRPLHRRRRRARGEGRTDPGVAPAEPVSRPYGERELTGRGRGAPSPLVCIGGESKEGVRCRSRDGASPSSRRTRSRSRRTGGALPSA